METEEANFMKLRGRIVEMIRPHNAKNLDPLDLLVKSDNGSPKCK